MNNSTQSVTFNRKEKGRAAEEAAANYVEQQGWTILERNWSCRSGELDLIAENGETIVIVEVRSRSGLGYGSPAESVDRRKIQKVRQTAEIYLQRVGKIDRRIRFDVIAVMLGRQLNVVSLEHIEDAF
ncbi:YraN family protein [Saccharibacillus sp. JS10]|uniref:YraN family protein n=1 Tax=Saccharibacillus sp. JS10 TaxID=2950552 RepID=UPI00210DB8B5|nr:YraN family protein [Saccharibacillus sp. JS10]MCQ4087172.1 YraN family protein [Saccharibacillus sp. JS10]